MKHNKQDSTFTMTTRHSVLPLVEYRIERVDIFRNIDIDVFDMCIEISMSFDASMCCCIEISNERVSPSVLAVFTLRQPYHRTSRNESTRIRALLALSCGFFPLYRFFFFPPIGIQHLRFLCRCLVLERQALRSQTTKQGLHHA